MKEKKMFNCPNCNFEITGQINAKILCLNCNEAFKILKEFDKEEELPKVEGEYGISLNIPCPHCKESNDYYNIITCNDYVLLNESESDLDIEVRCLNCEKRFILEKTIF